ncbi:MAG TPA: YARHG domain-containing protein [Chitinophagaceae bacterium]|nr:YARHG domain-containing protein [Chitinophagaceae bacterium]HPG10201.1 YARHG domain-containing protein [Chitinophagaceae bacterium]HRX94322.1 YARHG domain-containing protein [Chitinophagaceae bacterium]
MRPVLLWIALPVFIACNNNSSSTSKTGTEEFGDPVHNEAQTDSARAEIMYGSYVGAFGDNKITMLITTLHNDSISGRTIVGGNDRPFNGIFTKKGVTYYIHAAEPGDHKDDGVFDFEISESNTSDVNGTWKPNDANRPSKTYTLSRKKFEYKTDVGDYPEASQRLLEVGDVENLFKEDLEFMRNEIFARHGYCFNRKHLRQQFEMQDWYVPNTTDIKGFLTDIEKKNITLIKRYEKYADEYGDEYGR